MLPPRVTGWHHATVIGDSQYPNLIHEWVRDALLLSEPHFKRQGRWSGGGPFFVVKRSQTHGNPLTIPYKVGFGPGAWFIDKSYTMCGAAGIDSSYPGDAALAAQDAAFQTSAFDDAKRYRAEGFEKTRPGTPIAGVAQYLAELRDLPKLPLEKGWEFMKLWMRKHHALQANDPTFWPRMFKAVLADLRNVDRQWLNVTFGWKPFLADLRKFYYLQRSLDARLQQLVRENGKSKNRRVRLVAERDTTQTVTDYSYPYANVYGSPPIAIGGTTRYTVTSYTQTDVWYSASYRYWVPDIGSVEWTKRATIALFGAAPTPDVLYALLPWSWLNDWFSNTRSVINNTFAPNAVYNLTTNYAYTMRHKVEWDMREAHVVHPGSTGFYNVPSVDHVFRSAYKVETKARLGGENPYGLDYRLPDLSLYQLSILSALGISRSRVLR